MHGYPVSLSGAHNEIPPTGSALSMKDSRAIYFDFAANPLMALLEVIASHKCPLG